VETVIGIGLAKQQRLMSANYLYHLYGSGSLVNSRMSFQSVVTYSGMEN